jgi:hypothetical protein
MNSQFQVAIASRLELPTLMQWQSWLTPEWIPDQELK